MDDEAVARDLVDALRVVRPHLDEVARRAKAAFTWRTVDADLLLAQLSFDSGTTDAPALTRDAGGANRLLIFSTDLRSVEIEVLADRLVGQFLPPSTGQVQVEVDLGVHSSVDVDDLGFFVVEPLPTGTIRLRCTTATTSLVTEWVCL
jgi:hypothetical protein